MHRPDTVIIDTGELPFSTPIIRVAMHARTTARNTESVPDRYAPIVRITHPNKIAPFSAAVIWKAL